MSTRKKNFREFTEVDLLCHETIICILCDGLITTNNEVDTLCQECNLRVVAKAKKEMQQLKNTPGLSEKYIEEYWFRYWLRVHLSEKQRKVKQSRITDYFKIQKRNKYLIFNRDAFVKSLLK